MYTHNSSSNKKPFWLKENTGHIPAVPEQNDTSSSSSPPPRLIFQGSDGTPLSPETIEKIKQFPAFAAQVATLQKRAAEKKNKKEGASNTEEIMSDLVDWIIPGLQEMMLAEAEEPVKEGVVNDSEGAVTGKDGIGDSFQTMETGDEGVLGKTDIPELDNDLSPSSVRRREW